MEFETYRVVPIRAMSVTVQNRKFVKGSPQIISKKQKEFYKSGDLSFTGVPGKAKKSVVRSGSDDDGGSPKRIKRNSLKSKTETSGE